MEKSFGKDLNWLFELRSVGDYGVTVHVPKQEAEQAIEAARRFVQAAQFKLQEAENEWRLPQLGAQADRQQRGGS